MGPQRLYDKPDCAKTAARAAWIWKTYGITMEQYQTILDFQGGNCGCCGEPFKPGTTPHIDHEHGGHVRGIVHPYCNTRLIGRLKDAERARRLWLYLSDPPAVKALGGPVKAPGRPKQIRRRRAFRRTKT